MRSFVAVSDHANSRHASMMRIVSMVFDEAVEELGELGISQPEMQAWAFHFSKLIEWCATGKTDGMDEYTLETIRRFENDGEQAAIAD